MTSEMKQTAALAGSLADVSYSSLSLTALGLFIWAVSPFINSLRAGASFTVMEAALIGNSAYWLALFAWLPRDRKTFAAATMKVWLVHALLPEALVGAENRAVVGPWCLLMSAAGPLRVARVPCLGTLLMQLLLGSCCGLCSWCRLRAGSQEPSSATSSRGRPPVPPEAPGPHLQETSRFTLTYSWVSLIGKSQDPCTLDIVPRSALVCLYLPLASRAALLQDLSPKQVFSLQSHRLT